ncbi:MAG: hypothetical protein LBB45_02065 [Methanobrevibacter sp.]|nr:hypothetical protein [Candidatus Methanovirga basalitermitum]
MPFNYNPFAKGEKLKKILKYAFDKESLVFRYTDDIKGVLEITGYSLGSSNPNQIIVFLHGQSNNSKSLYLSLIDKLHDNNISSIPLKDMGDRFVTSGLIDKSLNSVKEIDNSSIKDMGDL